VAPREGSHVVELRLSYSLIVVWYLTVGKVVKNGLEENSSEWKSTTVLLGLNEFFLQGLTWSMGSHLEPAIFLT